MFSVAETATGYVWNLVQNCCWFKKKNFGRSSILRFACRNTAHQIYPLNIGYEDVKGDVKLFEIAEELKIQHTDKCYQICCTSGENVIALSCKEILLLIQLWDLTCKMLLAVAALAYSLFCHKLISVTFYLDDGIKERVSSFHSPNIQFSFKSTTLLWINVAVANI